MIQVYANEKLVYDSRLEQYALLGLKVTTGLNVGGTAEIVMPPGHPAYGFFVGQRTVVTVYRDGELRFRGRALYPADNFLGQRTITCEGELCFLRDSINRPYKYQASPRSIFVTLINAHNKLTDDFKKFTVGEVTVEDDNDYVLLESESAETILATLNKAIERCGGYITITGPEGARTINWLADLGQQSGQVIEFGENLLDFTSTGANTTALATGLVPYGAKDEKTKKRITIESVNGGKDYILADDATDVRGIIMTTHTWDDVTKPSNLLKKAKAFLKTSKLFITSLELTALDLSYLDSSIDRFAVGDLVTVRSAPHGVDDTFQLATLTEDLLNPANSKITLGKDFQTLTGAGVVSDFQTQASLGAVRVDMNSQDLSGYATKDELVVYATKDDLGGYAPVSALETYATQAALNAEINARAGMISKSGSTVNLGGGAAIKINGSTITITSQNAVKLDKSLELTSGSFDTPNGSGLRVANASGSHYYVIRQDENNDIHVGNTNYKLYLRGPTVYLHQSNAVVTSDERQKNSIEELPQSYVDMLDKLTPVRFKYNDGQSGRYHVGFIAQDVERALTESGLTSQDFGGFVDLNGDGKELGLAYDEFIGLLFQKIRGLEKRLETLEGKA